MRDSFERIVNILVRAIIAVVVFLLFLQSIFSTSFIGQIPGEDGGIQDHTLNVADSPFLHLGILLTVTVVSVVLYRAYQKREHNIQHIGLNAVLYIIAAAGFLLGTVWILATQLYPGSDPAKVCHVAAQWRAGDFSAFEQLVDGEEGYLFRYPFQSGIVLFYYLLMGILGTENYVGLQFVNLLALTVSYYLIVQILKQFCKEDKAAVIFAHTALILWEPYMFYITYLYGIMPGMACSLGAVYCVVRYLGTRKPLYMLPAALLMGIATGEKIPLSDAEIRAKALELGLVSRIARDQAEAEAMFAESIGKEDFMDLKDLKANHPELMEELAGEVRKQCEKDSQKAIADARSETFALIRAVAGDEIAAKIEAVAKAGVTASQLQALQPMLAAASGGKPTEEEARELMLGAIRQATGDPLPNGGKVPHSRKSQLVADAERRASQRMVV